MRLALVHDYLCGLGGSERVFQYICEAFPEADVFTLAYNPVAMRGAFGARDIRTTWLNGFVRSPSSFRWSFPLATRAMESLDLGHYDIVLSSSATVAKYVNVPDGFHICYCYIPTRALWQFEEYFQERPLSRVVKPFLGYLQRRDYAAAQRVDRYVAISEATKEWIRKCYGRDSSVLPCPIDVGKFYASPQRGDHYLLVSRLEPWKRVDYAVEAFNRLGSPLRVVGIGSEFHRLRESAGRNIEFLGEVNDEALALEYSRARAVVFTPFMEYTLIPLEATASGTPVIAYGKGGIFEIMTPYTVETRDTATAVFFYEQSADALVAAIREFEGLSFDPHRLREHASKWDIPEFQRRLIELVREESQRRRR